MLASNNDGVNVIPNTKDQTFTDLTPAAVTGTLTVPVGRVRKMTLGQDYLTGFSVGGQRGSEVAVVPGCKNFFNL